MLQVGEENGVIRIRASGTRSRSRSHPSHQDIHEERATEHRAKK